MKHQPGYGAFVLVVLVVIAAAVGWTWLALTWSYSEGERVGFVQKLSKKGWICKTWEGELNMVVLPGAIPDKFYFTVREDGIADKINKFAGKRVSLDYQEHRFIPKLTRCRSRQVRLTRDTRMNRFVLLAGPKWLGHDR
jgi:hypothetical protein